MWFALIILGAHSTTRDARKVDFRAVNVATEVAASEPCRQILVGGVKADTRRHS